MDIELKVLEVIPKVSCGPDMIQTDDPFTFCAERTYSISDEELTKLDERFLELMKSRLKEDVEHRMITHCSAPHYISKCCEENLHLKLRVKQLERDVAEIGSLVARMVSALEEATGNISIMSSKLKVMSSKLKGE